MASLQGYNIYDDHMIVSMARECLRLMNEQGLMVHISAPVTQFQTQTLLDLELLAQFAGSIDIQMPLILDNVPSCY